MQCTGAVCKKKTMIDIFYKCMYGRYRLYVGCDEEKYLVIGWQLLRKQWLRLKIYNEMATISQEVKGSLKMNCFIRKI